MKSLCYNIIMNFKQVKVVTMIRMSKRLGVILFVSCISINSFAKSMEADVNAVPEYNYDDIPYYENEGSLLVKMRLNGVFAHAKQKNLPAPTVPQPLPIGEFVKNGYGGDISTTIFFNNYFATELSLGFNVLRTKNSVLSNVSYNYGVGATPGKSKPLYMIPATITGQFHMAPFGGIRPYVGLGYHGSYMITQSSGIKIRNGNGFVGQIGLDFYAKDDTVINLDIKQYYLNPKIVYKPSLVGNQNITSRTKLNPLVVSIGIGFSF